MCKFGVNGGLSWLFGTNGVSFFTCKNEVENITHFFFLCPNCQGNFEKLWSKLETEILNHSATGETHIFNHINKATITRAIYRPDSFVLILRYCANLKAISYQ